MTVRWIARRTNSNVVTCLPWPGNTPAGLDGSSADSGGAIQVVGDCWYAEVVSGVTPLDAAAAHWPPMLRWFLRLAIFRGVALFRHARSGVIVTTYAGLASKVCLLLCALTGRRRVVLLEFIVQIPTATEHSPRRRQTLRRMIEAGRRFVLARSMARAQVLAETDIETYSSWLHLPAERFRLIRWPQRSEVGAWGPLVGGRTVLASGRRVDWATVIDAAVGTDWDLVLVCSAQDAEEVAERCRRCRVEATVHVEISQAAHRDLVAAATVYVIAVPETGTSIGQIRVMNAVDAGAPLVVSDVVGLHGYIDDSTAALVPPGQPTRLRTAICALLDDPERRDSLRRAARDQARYTMDDYLREVSELCRTLG